MNTLSRGGILFLQCNDTACPFQVLILLKAGSNWKKYFISRRTLLTNGFFGSLFVSFKKITEMHVRILDEMLYAVDSHDIIQ
jgi:hypothetical protein